MVSARRNRCQTPDQNESGDRRNVGTGYFCRRRYRSRSLPGRQRGAGWKGRGPGNSTILERIGRSVISTKNVDLSISSTTNLPKSATIEQIKDVYIQSWKANLKGNTIYVDGSLDGVLNTVDENSEESVEDLGCGS